MISTMAEKQELTAQAEKLKALVDAAGGPSAFASKYSQSIDNPIDPTYISQILNGHRGFRDVARRNMARRAGLPDNYFETVNEARQPEAPAYIGENLHDGHNAMTAEVLKIMLRIDEEGRRDILGAARLALTQYNINHPNSK